MKAVPLLVVTNALAIGMAIVLYFKVEEVSTQVGSTRTSRRSEAAVDLSEVDARLDRLERAVREAPRPVSAPAVELPGSAALAVPTAGGVAAPAAGLEGGAVGMPEAPSGDGSADAGMDAFRNHVRKAIELNNEEDRVQRVVDSIDGLVAENKIAPLNEKQKVKVAEALLSFRTRVPEVWRRARESTPDGASRDERFKAMRTEMETLRVEAQTSLETVVPAADAKTILDDLARDGMARFGFGGGDGPPTPGRQGRNRRQE
jgi:hypothetical protein